MVKYLYCWLLGHDWRPLSLRSGLRLVCDRCHEWGDRV